MRFELPGLTFGPTDQDIERLERHQVRLEVPSGAEEENARRLGLSVEQW